MSSLKLYPNPIPPDTHGRNLRSMLPQEDWDTLRIDCYMSADYKCVICGGVGKKHPVECHEEWELDADKRTQTLIKLLALCPDCHLVKHIGRAEHIGKFKRAFKHFCKVNNITKEHAENTLRDLLNSYQVYLGVRFKINIDLAKKRLLELLEERDEVLTAFPIHKKGKRK